jgi:ethanolamine ammonia-lyase large subunit
MWKYLSTYVCAYAGVSTNIVKANPSKGKQIDMCFQLVCSSFSTFDFFGIQVENKIVGETFMQCFTHLVM